MGLFLRSLALVGYSRNSHHFMECEMSLLSSYKRTIGFCPEPNEMWMLSARAIFRNEAGLWSICDSSYERNSVAWVRERTIPTERPPLVGEVSSNFCEYRVQRGQRDGSLRPYSRLSRPEPLLFLSSSFSIVFTRLSGPRSRMSGSAGNRTRAFGFVTRNSDH
jgi:hypothetical protein